MIGKVRVYQSVLKRARVVETREAPKIMYIVLLLFLYHWFLKMGEIERSQTGRSYR